MLVIQLLKTLERGLAHGKENRTGAEVVVEGRPRSTSDTHRSGSTSARTAHGPPTLLVHVPRRRTHLDLSRPYMPR